MSGGLASPVSRGLDAMKSVARANGHGFVVTSARRSRATQLRLWTEYLAGRSAYPVAPPGTSKHERGLAFDAVVYPSTLQSAYGQLWESWGGRWGGRFGDPIHFEV